MLEQAFSSIDLFGIPIILNFAKATKAKSSCGGFCSLVFLAFVIWSFYTSGYELFAREKPQIIDGTVYSKVLRPLEISSLTMPLTFAVMKSDGEINTKFCQYMLLPSLVGQSPPVAYALERCTLEHIDVGSEQFEEFNLSSYSCLPKKIGPTLILTEFAVNLICLPQDGLEEFLSETPLATVAYLKNGLTLRDYSNPVQSYSSYDQITLKSGAYVLNSWSISHLNITTDDGWLTTSEKTSQYIQLAPQTSKDVKLGNYTGILYQFMVAGEETYYLRSYKKVQNVLAEVGGIANVVFTVILVLVTPYARIKLSEAFVNELFEVKKYKGHKSAVSQRLSSKGSANRAKKPQEAFIRDVTKKRGATDIRDV